MLLPKRKCIGHVAFASQAICSMHRCPIVQSGRSSRCRAMGGGLCHWERWCRAACRCLGAMGDIQPGGPPAGTARSLLRRLLQVQQTALRRSRRPRTPPGMAAAPLNPVTYTVDDCVGFRKDLQVHVITFIHLMCLQLLALCMRETEAEKKLLRLFAEDDSVSKEDGQDWVHTSGARIIRLA